MFYQNLQHEGTCLLVRGIVYRFDVTGTFKGQGGNFSTIGLIPVDIISFIEQGDIVERAVFNEYGELVTKFLIEKDHMLQELREEQSNKSDCLALLFKPLFFKSQSSVVSTKQYLVVKRKQVRR